MAGRMSSKMKAKRAGKSNSDKTSDKSEEEFDTSILSKPLETSINNIAKVLKLYQTTTEEIRGYLVKECDILYECRICRSIFRSLSNLILHKRLFCEEKYDHQNSRWPRKEEDEYLDIIIKETNTTTDKNGQLINSKKNLNSIIDGLTQKKQFGFEIENFSVEEFYKHNQESFNSPIVNSNKKLNLEQIQGSSAAVFQTLKLGDESKTKIDDIKLEAMEIQQLTEGQTAVLGPDGKVVNINQTKQISIEDTTTTTDDSDLTCKKCIITFTTRKTFLSHMKYKHDNSRLVYPCLECSETFVSVWSVYRHLYNVHRKSLPEVRKMRSKIQSKAFQKKEDSEEDKLNAEEQEQKSIQQNIHELNQQWMDNFETDNDIQMCGGCGRRFERKAALNSHSQTCQKRIAAKNIINSNKQKRIAAAEEKLMEKKSTKAVRSESEADKKYYDSQNVTKKRKIGIQIRCDYSKPADKAKTKECSAKKDPVPPVINEEKKNEKQSTTPEFLTTYVNKNIPATRQQQNEVELLETEVVSIPSSNSSPGKDETDPLAIKDLQSSSESELEEIIDPNDICEDDVPSSESFEIKSQFEDDDNKMKLTNLNETTLKLIELINSDITKEKLQPTLDEKMSSYVNLKKLLCIPCDLKFGNISKLRHHMSTHFNWWRFKCDICAFKAYDKNDVIEHVKEKHNIQSIEKIEAIIFFIPDWETYELSSKDFIEKNNSQNVTVSSEEIKMENPISYTPDISGCIIIEPGPEFDDNTTNNKNKSSKKNRNVKITKTRNKNTDIKKEVSTDGRSDNSEVSDNDPGESSTSTNAAEPSNPQDLRKMVYEVIFGDVTKSSSTISSTSSSEEKDSLHVVSSNDVSSKVISRPVRNRVKHIDKDFIYDLSEFKEQQKTVLVSNTTRGSIIKSVSNQISELLEDNMVMVSGNGNKYNKKSASTNKTDQNCLENMGNIVKTLNLQKKGRAKFVSSDNQGARVVNSEEFSLDKVTIVDPKTFLNQNISEGDDDIYIVENEELVAVK